MIKKYSQQGFTLIELLVVIAIIGILSSVVLASLSTARSKASNSSVKSELSSFRSESEIIAGDTSNYSTVCSSSPGTSSRKIYDAAVTAAGAADGSTAVCRANASYYVVAVNLKITEGQIVAWCVDNNGTSKGVTTLVTNSSYSALTACPN